MNITAIIAAALGLSLAAVAQAADEATPNRRNSTDIHGTISGDLNAKQRYYYKRSVNEQPGCHKDKNGNIICK